jgi:signal transduction histidine kinase
LFIVSGLSAQDQKIADSLVRIYNQGKLEGPAKFELLTDLSFNEVRDLKKGLKYAEELIRLASKEGERKYLRRGYFLKGNKKRALGDLDEALAAYFKSAELARELHDFKSEADCYGAIADAYAIVKNPTNFRIFSEKAINTLKQSPLNTKEDSIHLASAIANAGDGFLRFKNFDSALLFFNDAKLIFDKAHYLSGKGYSLGNIGMVYANTGKNTLAERNINEAIRILEKAEDYYPICVYLVSIADIYSAKGDKTISLKFTLKSLRLAEQYGLKEQISDASFRLSQLYDSSGNIAEAYKYFKKHIAYRDSINNIPLVQQMADQRTRYEISQKQLEVDLLNSEKRNLILLAVIIVGLAILLLIGLFWFFKFKSRERARMQEQELLNARLEIQEQTYRIISEELHDNIGQVLTLVKININLIEAGGSEVAKEKLVESKKLLTEVIQDLRDLSKTLNADYINEIGLANAVNQQLQLLKRTGLYSVEFSIKGEVYSYEPERALIIFRIVQELLNNIMKHADAKKIEILMNYEAEKLVIKVRDDGKGFDIEAKQLQPAKGLGLQNIYNRLKLIRATILFQSAPTKGTTAIIQILR